MLQKIRDGSSGPLAYIVVAVIAVVFGVWGIGSYFTPPSDPVVASAAGTKITQSQFRNAFNERYQQLRQRKGEDFDSSKFPRDQVRKQVLDNLIDQVVMTNYAKNNGYQVTDADLLSYIRSNPQFQEGGKFSIQRYKNLLSQSRMTPSQYESRLRQGMLEGQVRQLIMGTAFAAVPAVDEAYMLAHEQRNVDVLSLNPSQYADKVSVDDKDIKAYYNQHAKQFMQSPQAKLAYVLLSADHIQPEKPDEAQLKALYQTHRNELGTAETRSADEIRLDVPKGKDEDARKTVQKILAAVQGGKSLQAAAQSVKGAQFKQVDNQPQSALPDAVGAALFKLKSGQLSSPVKSGDAWYLLQLTSVTPASIPDFDNAKVQQQLKTMARKKSIAEVFRKESQKLEDLAFQAPNNLETVSGKMDLKIQHTGWISEKGDNTGLGQSAAVRKAAFSDAVLQDRLNSKVLDLGDQRRVVIRVTDYKKAERKPLEQVSDTIRKRLIVEKTQQLARQTAQKAKSQMKEDKSLANVASAVPGAKLKQLGFVGRDNDQVDASVLQAAFALPEVKKDGEPASRIVTGDDGQVDLVVVTQSRLEKDKSDKSGPSRQQIAYQLSSYNGYLEYAVLDQYLRKQAKVKIHKDILE